MMKEILFSPFEEEAKNEGFKIIAGIDEAGRGCIAGPVVAAACVLPAKLDIIGINDSKLLLPKKREKIFEQLRTCSDISYGIGISSSKVIDKINVYQATIAAMLEAVNQLPRLPDLLLVDGIALDQKIPCKKIIKGDRLSQSIAAASILAKVTRDRLMKEYHIKWPRYHFNENKGYFTARHRAAFEAYGPCPIHRLSFIRK